MKKKIILLLGIILLITGCGNSNLTNIVSNESIFKNYFKKIVGLNNYESNEYANFLDYKLIDNNYQGGLSGIVLENYAIEFYIDNQDIKAKLLNVENGKVNEIQDEKIYSLGSNNDSFTLNVFSIGDDTEKYFMEFNGYSSLFADGKTITIIPITITESKISIGDKITESFSALSPDEQTRLEEKITNIGLTCNNLSTTAFEQTEDAKEYFKIERKHLSSFDLSSSYSLKSRSVNYGITKFTITTGNLFKEYEKSDNTYDDSYIGEYTYEDGDDTYELSFVKEQDGSVTYYLSYYPKGSIHASEELWGNWDTSNNKMEDINNENTNSLAEYSFDKISYLDAEIDIKIKVKSIKDDSSKSYIIKDGTYKFIKH